MSGDVESPWSQVTAGDYDGHMASPAVGQEPILDRIFDAVLRRYRPRSLAVPGCGTGTGFRHIDPAVTTDVVATDINVEFLDVVRERYAARLPRLELIAGDLETLAEPPGRFDLVHVALVFEHVDEAIVVPRLAQWVALAGVMTVVLQLPSAEAAPVVETPFESLRPVRSGMHLVAPSDFRNLAAQSGLAELDAERIDAPNGKAFEVGHFSPAT